MFFRFTLFNGIVLLILALTVWMIVLRVRGRYKSKWAFLYYTLVLAFSVGFHGSLDLPWVMAGFVFFWLAFRFGSARSALPWARFLEMVFLVYAGWRSIALLLMLPW